jgi:type IV pilus assembly protein PilE
LIELMIVTVIVGILMVIAYPSYQQQIIKSRREAAQGELVQLASIQEKIYLNSNAYTLNVTAAYTGASTGGLGYTIGTTDGGRYTIAFDPASTAQSYIIVATPVTGSTQAADGFLSISSTGQRLWVNGATTKTW